MNPNSQPDLVIAGLVHDLNNIFETISEAAELLSGDRKWERLAGTIERSVERGRDLVGSFADQSRAAQDLDVVVDRAVSFVQDFLAIARHAPVAIERKTEPGLRLRGQPSEWERVFMNLLLNAAQAMAEGGTIVIQAGPTADGMEILVTDNGPGIPKEILKDIFKPRFSTRKKHSGLGLHIVASLVEKNGGTVTASNRNDAPGASFSIQLRA